MSRQELKRVEGVALRRSGQIDQAEAARRLGLTVRQVRRLEAEVATDGAAGLRSARRWQPGNHRLALTTVAEVGPGYRAALPWLATAAIDALIASSSPR
jgi:hypothetical protein